MKSNFGNVEKDILQRIFRMAVVECWQNTDEESNWSSGDEEEEHTVFIKESDPFKDNPSLLTITTVCRQWADAVFDMRFWKSTMPLDLSLDGERLPAPWKIGKRWNRFFAAVPCIIPCSEKNLLS